jgi:5-methyltetrahydropteroyltriglutamate--homocysteine methyltransferase
MKIKSSIHSSFPRIGEHPDDQKLRRAISALEEGKITQEEFAKIQNQVVDDVLKIEEQAGIEIVTDGLIRWHDPASHVAKALKGFEINGLLRLFDTNFYFRQPVINDSIGSGNGALAGEITYLREKSSRPAKAVLPGPITLAGMSLNKSAMKFDELCGRLSQMLSDEIAKIAQNGASYIQIEEPWLVRNPEYFDLLKPCFDVLAKSKGSARLLLSFHFGNVGIFFERLPEIPADIFGIDFTYAPGLLEKIARNGFPKPLAFGLLDGRNTKLEDAGVVALTLENSMRKVDLSDCHITTSCGLEFLPRQYAIKKLELTVQIARMING